MLHPCTKQLVRNQVADFAENLIGYALDGNHDDMLKEMTSFYEFFCGALTVAMKDGRKVAERTSLN